MEVLEGTAKDVRHLTQMTGHGGTTWGWSDGFMWTTQISVLSVAGVSAEVRSGGPIHLAEGDRVVLFGRRRRDGVFASDLLLNVTRRVSIGESDLRRDRLVGCAVGAFAALAPIALYASFGSAVPGSLLLWLVLVCALVTAAGAFVCATSTWRLSRVAAAKRRVGFDPPEDPRTFVPAGTNVRPDAPVSAPQSPQTQR